MLLKNLKILIYGTLDNNSVWKVSGILAFAYSLVIRNRLGSYKDFKNKKYTK